MPRSDTLIRAADLIEALALLTRLPLPHHTPRSAASAWAWPVAGALVGALSAAVGLAALALGVPPVLAAGFVLVCEIALTGALHEDGLADSADGLWGGHDRARRLAIMKDSRIGSYGVLALGLGVLLRWGAVVGLAETGGLLLGLIAAGAVSRAPMALAMVLMPSARPGGLAASVGNPPLPAALLGAGLAGICAVALLGAVGVWMIFVVAIVAFGVARLAVHKIGGQTGDILGAMQQLSLIAALTVLASQA